MRVLVGCEVTGIVREAFAKLGHIAYSCDLLDSISCGNHIKGDIFDYLDEGWDLLIAHPPCQYLCASGIHWTKRGKRDPQLTEDALDFVRRLMDAPINKICIENPIGVISTTIRKPDQYIQPYEFGEDASKKTGLWLKNLPKLRRTRFVEPRIVNGKERWANQTDSGHNVVGPVKDRWIQRAATYKGIANAMAWQWGGYNFKDSSSF